MAHCKRLHVFGPAHSGRSDDAGARAPGPDSFIFVPGKLPHVPHADDAEVDCDPEIPALELDADDADCDR